MTSLDKDAVTVPAIGHQAQSTRRNLPSYSFIKAGREQREKVFITKDHIKTSRQGREGALGTYTVKRELGGVSVGFSKAPGTDLILAKSDCGGLYTNDELAIPIDSQPYKYRRDATILIGTDPRGKLKDADLLKNHSAAFFGRESPGPAAIGPEFGPNIEPTRERLVRDTTIAGKLPCQWSMGGDTPGNVGPGIYVRKDVSIGKQHLSKRKNQSVHAFSHQPKFPKDRSADSIVVLDAAKSSFGKQGLSKNRSEPSVGFGCGSRDKAGRVTICRTVLDQGPKATMPRTVFSMPSL